MKLGTWRRPKRDPYRLPNKRIAWSLGVEARRRRKSIDRNPFTTLGMFELWACWRRGFLEAGGYCAFLRPARRRR